MTPPARMLPQRRRGVWSATQRSSGVAIDLGSARTRAWMPDCGLLVDAPTITPAGVGDGSRPVQRGVVVDVHGATRCLDHLFGRAAGLGRYSIVVLTTPLLCTELNRGMALAALEVLDARTVVTIESVKAAALGAGADLTRPLLVVDVGADLTEVGLLVDGGVTEASRFDVGTSDLDVATGLADLVQLIVGAVTQLLRRDCGAQVVDALDRGLLLAGGGALRPEITYRLSKRLLAPVWPAPAPHNAAVRGAGIALVAVQRHPSLPGED